MNTKYIDFYHIFPLFCSRDFEVEWIEMITNSMIQYSHEIAYNIMGWCVKIDTHKQNIYFSNMHKKIIIIKYGKK